MVLVKYSGSYTDTIPPCPSLRFTLVLQTDSSSTKSPKSLSHLFNLIAVVILISASYALELATQHARSRRHYRQ
jgi:hypothetical protein